MSCHKTRCLKNPTSPAELKDGQVHTKQTDRKSTSEEEIHTEESVDLISEDFDIEACHQQGSLLIILTGPEANKVKYTLLKNVIARCFLAGESDIIQHHFQDQTQWYAKLKAAANTADYARLHVQTFEAEQPRLTIKIEHLDKRRQKGTLNWLPSTIRPEAEGCSSDTRRPRCRISRAEVAYDKWNLLYRPRKPVPH